MKYSIIIPTYNNCDKFLKPCIDSIIKYTNMKDVELIVVANGCTDNTSEYLNQLQPSLPKLDIVVHPEPLGFAKAVNLGIYRATTDKIVILNNDIILLDQPENEWLKRLDVGGIGAVLTSNSTITNSMFAIFFCVMIKKLVIDTIGMLDEDFLVGGCEDIDFCFRAKEAGFSIVDVGDKGDFPIYHYAEGTVHDESLVTNWKHKFYTNELKLAKKHNIEHYKFLISNNYERAVFLKDDEVFPRERQRYEWAAKNLLGDSILEIGCSTGYGCQFFPWDIEYVGTDYDPVIIEVAKQQNWRRNAWFAYADINTFELTQHNTIIAFEVIEHLDNGLEIIEKLKKHCKRLLITVPYDEPKGFWGEHHKLHGLTEKDFPGFSFNYINHAGYISALLEPISEQNMSNLMLCRWDNE
jgi:GT2 family glycosyltransferase